MKILLLDIETAPNLAHVWRFYNQDIGANQVIEHCSLLSFAARWLGEEKIHFHSVYKSSERSLLVKLNILLDKADATITHNGRAFDMPKIRGRSLVYGISPPSPLKEIDTCVVARKEFGFDSNSLEYLAIVLECKAKKYKHRKFPGHELWTECLKDNPEAWAEMKFYNMHDIVILEEVYYKMLPYMTRHPNMGVFMESDERVCPKCGSTKNHKDGFAHTMVGKYQQYQCNDCGGWMRDRYTVYDKEKRKVLTVNVAT